MNLRGLISLTLLLWLPPLTATATSASQAYRIDAWQVDDGLPQSSVTSIVQTHDGYLWLGTFGGLVRFDGVQFKVFTPNNSPGLPSRRILALFEDHHGTLWVGTEEGYLARYSNGRFHTCSPSSWARLSGYIQGFAETHDQLWLITPEYNLIRFPENRLLVTSTNAELVQTNVSFLAGDPLGQLWAASGHEVGLWKDGKWNEVIKVTHSDELNPVVIAGSQKGGCWVAADGCLRKITRQGCVADYGAFPWSKGNVVRMLEDYRGQLWVGTYGSGLYCYGTNGEARHFSIEDGLPGDFIRSLCEDREGNIWVGTDGYGLARVKPVVFQSIGQKQGLSGDAVTSVCQGAEGELWIGLMGDGLDRLKDGVIRHYGAAQGLPNDYVWSVLYDRHGTLWVGTWGGGLCRLEGNHFAPFASPGECGGIVCALYQDLNGDVWVGQQRPEPSVVHIHDGKPIVTRLNSRFVGTDVRAFAQDKDGNLWIGTQGDGLYRLKHGEQTHFGRKDGLSNQYIRSLYVDDDGVLWIGTYGGGLDRFKDGKFTSFTTKAGLANDSLGLITEDGHGNLWCGSLGGVFRVSKKELNQFASGQTHWIRCLPFTTSDGLPSIECTGGCQPSGCKTRDGRLWFPTVRGLAVVDPDKIGTNLLTPPVAIDELVIEGKTRRSIADVASSTTPAPQDEPLKIAPGTQRIEFHYTALSLTAPTKVRFKYKLDGVEENWVEAGTRRSVNYSHLQPGSYQFRVQACNNDGVWNETGASVAFLILPHYWQTWWFRILCGAIIVLLVVAFYEMRVISERKLARMRLRIASDLHDEVGSNLGSIALLSEMVSKEAARPAEEIVEIRRIALRTVSSLRDIVWFLDPAADNMEELLLRMKDTARTLLPGTRFSFQSQCEADAAKPTLHLRRNVFPMFKEILHNIAKHAHATQVEIRTTVTPWQFQLEIHDNGVGFDESQVRIGNGLKNLRRRATDLGGTLEIRSTSGNGTTVTLTTRIA